MLAALASGPLMWVMMIPLFVALALYRVISPTPRNEKNRSSRTP